MATDVVTGIDSLLNYVSENGEVDTPTLANVLGVSESTVLEWSTVLERAKLIVITYKLGKMYVSPSASTLVINKSEAYTGSNKSVQGATEVVGVDEIKKLNEIKSTIIEDNLNIQQKNIDALNSKIKQFKEYMEGANKTLKENEPSIKSAAAELAGFKSEATKNLNEIVNYMNQINSTVEQLKGGTVDFNKEYLSFENVDVVSKNARAIIDDIRSKSSYMHSSINDLIREFDKRTSDSRMKLIEFSENVKKQERMLNELSGSIQKQLSVYTEKLEEYKKEASETNLRIRKERSALLDKAVLTNQKISRIYDAAEKRFDTIDSTINKELTNMKKIQDMYSEINKIKQNLDEIITENENIKKEIVELTEDIKKIKSDKKETAFKKYKNILEKEKKSKDIDQKVKKLNERLYDLNESQTPEDSKK